MSFPLFLKDIKYNILLLLVFGGMMSVYLAVIIFMYDPKGLGALNDLLAILPVTVVKALGFEMIDTGLSGFLASLYYGFLIYLFTLVYCVFLGQKLVAKLVYDKSFACLLSTPNSRIKLIATQGFYLLSSLAVLFLFIYLIGLIFSTILFAGMLDIGVFTKLNLGACLMSMAIGMICFFFSCLFNNPKTAFWVGSILPILFFICDVLSRLSESFQFLKNFSLYSLFNSSAIANGSANFAGICMFFLFIILLFFLGSIGLFQFKRLSI